MQEIWKHYIYNYEISNYGRLRNSITGKIRKNTFDKYGYVKIDITLGNNNKHKKIAIHRAVAQLFIPNPENKPQVNHIDGNKSNNNVDNLEWVTAKENIFHSLNNSLQPTGERCSFSKLSQKEVDYIRNNYKKRDKIFGGKALAKKFNIDESIISEIINKKIWKYN